MIVTAQKKRDPHGNSHAKANNNDFGSPTTQDGDQYSSPVELPPAKGSKSGASVLNSSKSFLEALNSLAEALDGGDDTKAAHALLRLKGIVAGQDFHPLMAFHNERISDYPFLAEFVDQAYLEDVYTPMSLMLEGPTGKNPDVTIELLREIGGLEQILETPMYRDLEDSEAAYLSGSPMVVDWLLDNGANRTACGGKRYESGVNIVKLDRKLWFLSEPGADTPELRKDIETRFRAALLANEKQSVEIINEQRVECDETRDVVAVLLDSLRLSDIPHEFVLSLLEIAASQSFDFQAFGRSYGVQNLLYLVCHDTSRPPHVEIVQFLLGVGLSPEAEISGLDISDGLMVEMGPDEIPEGEAYWDDGDNENEGFNFSYSGGIPKSAARLVAEQIEIASKDPEMGEELAKWHAIESHFKTFSRQHPPS
jgi:hypothetical protein